MKKMKPGDQNQPTIELRYRTLLILWFAISMSVLSLLVLVQFTQVTVEPNPKLSLILNGFGLVPLALSFLLKQRILDKAVHEQRIEQVQVAHVIAWALCEVSALLGLVDHFVNGSPYYFVGFILAFFGMLLHFPRRQYLLDASNQQF